SLIFQGARLSFYILFILTLPILCSTRYVLQLWLGEVPAHTVLFVQLILILTLNESLSGPLITAMLATGNIKKFQIVVGSLNLLNLPVSYLVLRLGAPPEAVVMVAIGISVCCTFARVWLLRGLIHLSARDFLGKVYFNVILVGICAAIAPIALRQHLAESFLTFVAVSATAVVCTILSALYVGSSSSERAMVYAKARTICTRLIKPLRH
ncbi:MAG: lipopolysaccharide biosynthesis protein, partial [Muribaculaceae bacterium]|nr:lipopolysaccharide biosynthesis protein [Muribaculaceae bacterium]